jgi:hypothetical protein
MNKIEDEASILSSKKVDQGWPEEKVVSSKDDR